MAVLPTCGHLHGARPRRAYGYIINLSGDALTIAGILNCDKKEKHWRFITTLKFSNQVRFNKT